MSNSSAPPPSWPSLYDPSVEILHIPGRNAVQPNAHYLNRAEDVFRFTFFWSLALYTPIFIICGIYAFFNLNFPPSPLPEKSWSYPLDTFPPSRQPKGMTRLPSKRPKEKERRSRLAFALLVLLTFLFLGVAGSVIGSAILGFTIFGLYKAGQFHMSTWIPFLLALIQVLTGLLSLWPSIIDII